ncbi:unnamed protein product, partial [Symbiodinium microadriaticum]
MPSDSSTELEKFCKDHGVHEVLYQALALKGLESVDDFAYAFPEIRSLEALLSGLSDSDLSDMGSTDQFHGVQAARIRKALRLAHDLCQQPIEPPQQIGQPPSLPAAILPQASPASWVENLPPKLSQEAAQELIDDFKTNYPGELLDEDTMPSHTWIRISDPSCPVIKMTRAAQTSLAWLTPRIAAIPTTPLSLPPILSSLARADAMAEGDQVGIGGWVSTKHGLAWFAEAYTMEEIRTFWPFLTKDAQKYIACFETLAQLALAMTAKAHHGHTRLSLCLPTESDNTPTEGGVNKLFTTAWPLSEFLSLI